MKRWGLTLLLVGTLGCVHATPATPGPTSATPVVTSQKLPVDPALKQAQIADSVVTRLSELQAAAIDANAGGGLTDKDTIPIVRFTVAASKVVRQVPNGWEPTVRASYTAFKTALPLSARTKFSALLTLLDALIGA